MSTPTHTSRPRDGIAAHGMSAPTPPTARRAGSKVVEMSPSEGRIFGGIVLAAFLLYGIGSVLADRPMGMILIAVNSVAVAVAGLLGFRLFRSDEHAIGAGYLAARVAEAALLAGGIVLTQHVDVADADTTGYLLAMIALAAGSSPFCRALRRWRRVPRPLATWGIYGYVALATGALLELVSGHSVTVVLAAPGGLFEIALGAYLLSHGFRPAATPDPPNKQADQRRFHD